MALTATNSRNRLPIAVLKRFTNTLLILALAGGAVFGMPMHSSGSESGMMACCKAALEQSKAPRVAAARLCCVMNCKEPGPTNTPGQSFFQNSLQPSLTAALALPTATSYEWPPVPYARTGRNSQPAYILNLALLI
jgi:hypothetical protein